MAQALACVVVELYVCVTRPLPFQPLISPPSPFPDPSPFYQGEGKRAWRARVRVIVSRARRAHAACAVPRAAYLEATWREARNVWILLKLTFVDKPSTPRQRARLLRREQTEAERFLWARLGP